MGLFKYITRQIEIRNEVLKGIKTKLKRIDKSLVCIAKEIGDLAYTIEKKEEK